MTRQVPRVSAWIRRDEIVGESKFQDAIAAIASTYGREHLTVRVSVADDDDVHVAFVVGDELIPCGFLAAERGRPYAELYRMLERAGNLIEVPARIFGGTEDKPNYGVWIGTDYGLIV